MRAWRFDRFGPPSVLRLMELPEPVPSGDEALIAVRAAAINPSDVKNVEGVMAGTTLPRTPGRDFAGVVVAGPREWQGAAVWGTGGDLGFTRDGTHAEALVVPVAALRRMPARLGFVAAAAAGTPYVTAALGLERAEAGAGQTVLVVGAAGAVGSAATQIAAWRGAHVVGVVRTAAQVALARAAGAEEAIVSGDGDPLPALRALLGPRGADVVFDTTGGWLDPAVQVLAQRGRVVIIAAPRDGKTTFDLRALYRHDATIFGVDSRALTAVDAGAVLERLAPGFEAGALVPPSVIERPLDEAAEAYKAREGKVVLLAKPLA
jgi:NADPH:quinone reductase-like Zn-dependent oxidoreductase